MFVSLQVMGADAGLDRQLEILEGCQRVGDVLACAWETFVVRLPNTPSAWPGMLRVSGILAVLFAQVLSGCRGSLFYRLPGPDHSDFELLEKHPNLRIFVEPRHLSSGIWDPLLTQIDEDSDDMLTLFSVQEAETVDVYLHASCEEESDECTILEGVAWGPTLVDMWFGKRMLDDVPRQLDTFRHEYTHAILQQQDYICPRRIFSEGTAEWAQLTVKARQMDLPPEEVVLDALIEKLEKGGAWISIGDLVNSADHLELSRMGHGMLVYRESAAFTWHLVDKGGLDKFMRFRQDACLLGEADLRDMLEKRYGTDVEAIDRALLTAIEARW